MIYYPNCTAAATHPRQPNVTKLDVIFPRLCQEIERHKDKNIRAYYRVPHVVLTSGRVLIDVGHCQLGVDRAYHAVGGRQSGIAFVVLLLLNVLVIKLLALGIVGI